MLAVVGWLGALVAITVIGEQELTMYMVATVISGAVIGRWWAVSLPFAVLVAAVVVHVADAGWPGCEGEGCSALIGLAGLAPLLALAMLVGVPIGIGARAPRRRRKP